MITDLAPETEYWFKAFIEIDDVPYSGEILNFTTDVRAIPEGAVDLGIEMTRGDGTTYKLYWARAQCPSGPVDAFRKRPGPPKCLRCFNY